jgi:hypothetical protein
MQQQQSEQQQQQQQQRDEVALGESTARSNGSSNSSACVHQTAMLMLQCIWLLDTPGPSQVVPLESAYYSCHDVMGREL